MNYEKMEWIATRTFTDEHIGKALTENELRERKEWETEYQDEINEASKIVKSSEYFGKLEFYQKKVIAHILINDLIETKDINKEIEDILNGKIEFGFTKLDIANKMMRILSTAKNIYDGTLSILVTITDNNVLQLPNESILLEKNISTLKDSMLAILEKVKEQIKTDYNVNNTYINIEDENKPITK